MSRVDQVAAEVLASVGEEKSGRGKLPLVFNTLADEVNLLAVRALLDFGSGYEDILEKESARGFRETNSFGIMHMHISGKPLDADLLATSNTFSVSQHFGLKGVTREEEVMGGVFKEVDGPLMPFAKLVASAMNETGTKLQSLNKSSLGEYILDKLSASLSASELVDDLVSTFASFRDEGESGDKLERKAVLLVRDLLDSFQDRPDCEKYHAQLQADLDSLPPAVDSDLIRALWKAEALEPLHDTFLDKLGNSPCLDVDTSAREAIKQEEKKVRSAAKRAVEKILAKCRESNASLTARDVETYLKSTYLDLGTPKLFVKGTQQY